MVAIIHFPYRVGDETRLMIQRLVEQGLLGKHWLERPSLAEYAHEDYEQLKPRILARDNYTCQYCGAAGVPLACDHIIPKSRGGLTHPENLVAVCKSCNSSKGVKTLEQWLIEPSPFARRLKKPEIQAISSRLALLFEGKAKTKLRKFLYEIHRRNKSAGHLSCKTTLAELANALGERKDTIWRVRTQAQALNILLFTPDLMAPGDGLYGINPNIVEWLPLPEYGGARSGAGRPPGATWVRNGRIVRKRWWEE